MSSKGFTSMLIAVLVGGGIVGGAFFGGLTIGKGQATETNVVNLTTPAQISPAGQTQPATQGQDLEQLRAQFQSGQVAPEELDRLRQQFQGQFGGGGPAGGFGGRAGLTGIVESIDGSTIILETQQGTIEATLSEDTIVRMTSEVPVSDLTAGMRVTINGERGDDGIFDASAITVTPDGGEGAPFAGGFPGGGFGGGRGFGGGAQSGPPQP